MASQYGGTSGDTERRPSNFEVSDGASVKGGPQIQVSTQCTKKLTWISVIFIMLHIALRIIGHIVARANGHGGGGGWNMTKFEELNPVDIAQRWEMRRSTRTLHVFDEIAGIIGWMCVLPVVMVGVRIISRGNPTSYVQWATPMFSFAVLIRLIEWTFNMGTRTGSDWMSSWSSMAVNSGESGVQLVQVLEVAYELARMKETWFFALDWLFIGGGVLCMSMGAMSENLMTRKHSIMGYVIAGLSVLQFIFDVSRLVPGVWVPFMIAGFITKALIGLILFPIWLVWFGNIVGKYKGTELNTLLQQ
jgi:hypothetical protein